MTIVTTRRIDQLGRLLLPVEMRREKKWEKGDLMAFYNTDGVITIDLYEQDYERLCTVCGKPEYKLSVRDLNVCDTCLAESIRIVKEKRKAAASSASKS